MRPDPGTTSAELGVELTAASATLPNVGTAEPLAGMRDVDEEGGCPPGVAGPLEFALPSGVAGPVCLDPDCRDVVCLNLA